MLALANLLNWCVSFVTYCVFGFVCMYLFSSFLFRTHSVLYFHSCIQYFFLRPKGILARLYLNIVPPTWFIFTVFSDLSDKNNTTASASAKTTIKRKACNRRWVRELFFFILLLLLFFIVIWRIGKRCFVSVSSENWMEKQS